MSNQLTDRPETLRAIAGGRAITEQKQQWAQNSTTDNIQPSISYSYLNLQRKNLFRLPFPVIRKIAFDISPELNKTFWDFLRFCNPGYIIEGDSDRAERATNEFISELTDMYGSFDNLLEMSFGNLFKDGRTVKELVLSEDARTPIDVFVPDPNIFEFRKIQRGARGLVWVLGQVQERGWVPLEDPTIFYLALDSDPKHPQGRSLVNPAIYDTISLILIKQAIQRVLENHGYSRQDYSVDTERLLGLIQEEQEDLTAKEMDERESSLINRFLIMSRTN